MIIFSLLVFEHCMTEISFQLVSTIQGTDMHTYTFTLNLDQPHSCSTTAVSTLSQEQFTMQISFVVLVQFKAVGENPQNI